MHAGNGDAVLQSHQLGEHLRALDNRDVQAMGFGDFRIFSRDGGTGDNHLGPRNVFGTMTLKRHRTQAGEPMRDRRRLQIGARNLESEIDQHLGNPAHADAANPHEMYTLQLCKQCLTAFSLRPWVAGS